MKITDIRTAWKEATMIQGNAGNYSQSIDRDQAVNDETGAALYTSYDFWVGDEAVYTCDATEMEDFAATW